MVQAEQVVKILNNVQLDFIKTEFGIDKNALLQMADDDIGDLYDNIGDIEVDETISAGDGELSERGKIAAGIVTLIGNELYS